MLEILINGQALDFKLEQEKTLNDVVWSIESWLSTQHLLVSGLVVDGQKVDPADRLFLMQRPVSAATRIDFSTASLAEIEGESSIEIMSYLNRLESSLKSGSDEIFSAEAREGLRWVASSLRLLAALHHFDLTIFPDPAAPICDQIEVIEKTVARLDAAPSDEATRVSCRADLAGASEVLQSQAYDLLMLINKRIDDTFDIAGHARQLLPAFRDLVDSIASIAADLQTGNEVRAMTLIQQSVLLIEELLRLIERGRVVHGDAVGKIDLGGETIELWMQKLLETGNAIIGAFRDKDSVLLGDLFEYEIRDDLAKVPGFLEQLIAIAAERPEK